MISRVSRLSCVLSAGILLLAAVLLSTGQLRYCGQSDAPRARIDVAAATGPCRPTLAPPQMPVVVQIESDAQDLEIGWAEN
jgi:hypothetical protein